MKLARPVCHKIRAQTGFVQDIDPWSTDMKRRHFLGSSLAATIALLGAAPRGTAAEAASPVKPLPRRGRVKVAFMLGDGANVIDTAGPWEVFQDVMLHDGEHHYPFELYTVAPTEDLITMTAGLMSSRITALRMHRSPTSSSYQPRSRPRNHASGCVRQAPAPT